MKMYVEYMGARPPEQVIWTWNGKRGCFFELKTGKKVTEALSMAHYSHMLKSTSEFQPLVPVPSEVVELAHIRKVRDARAELADAVSRKFRLGGTVNQLKTQADRLIAEANELDGAAKAKLHDAKAIASEVKKSETELEKIDGDIARKQAALEALIDPPKKRKKRSK